MPLLHYHRPEAFTPGECDAILRRGAADALEPATVSSGAGDRVDPAVRRAMRRHWPRDAEAAWIHDRLDTLFAEAAARFDLAVDPMFEDVQFVRYGPGDHFQSWHSDAGADLYYRRLISLSVELSDPGEFHGGLLEIAGVREPAQALPRGSARVFLSRAIHRVTPVERGVRAALVAWTGLREGPPA